MSYSTWVKGKDLRLWADALEARQKLPALVRRLIHATVECPTLAQFPADEGTQRRGWDGILEAKSGNAWVPKGKSVWEMGTDQDPKKKAESDYKKRTKTPGSIEINEVAFIFVTPRKWEGKLKWARQKRAEKKWRNVVVWDGDDLEQWLEIAPSVDAWLARLLGKLPTGVRDLSSYWSNLSATSNPPLPRSVFLAGRTKTETDLRAAITGVPAEITVSAMSLAELRDFLSAVLANCDEEAAAARAVIVETTDAWGQLSATKNRLILIPGDQLALEKPMVAEAVKGGHHVLTQRPYTPVRSDAGIRLPRAERWEIQKVLENAGFADPRAQRLARESGGCCYVLVRLASQYGGQTSPPWSKPNEIAPLLPLVLIGSWSDRNDEDRKLVERFTGQPYVNVQQLVTRWANHPDAPLRLAEGVYSFVSREDSWMLLNRNFTIDLLNDFMEVAKEVLGEHDPRFDMPVGERYLAGVHKKLPKFSQPLREGISETIALLGVRGEHTPQGMPGGAGSYAAALVRELLGQASRQRWFAVANNLPLFAEAAPDEFLTAVEADLRQTTPAISALFEKDANGIFSSSPHTNLMWALEILAWDTKHLSRVALVLAGLIKIDSGGRINPRPAGVLFDIFRFWYPQTSATIEERLQILELLSRREPEIAWTLLLSLIPKGHDLAMASVKPRWRECNSSQTKSISEKEITRQVNWAASRVAKIAETHPEKWPLLLKDFGTAPSSLQKAALVWLGKIDTGSLSESARLKTWEQIRQLFHQHRFFHNSWWALPKVTIGKLAGIEKKLAPSDPISRSKWLFSGGHHEAFGDVEMPYEKREQLHSEAQLRAVQEVFCASGLEGVFQLGSGSPFHFCTKIGDSLAKSGLLLDWQKLLPGKLLSNTEHERSIALGYASGRIQIEGSKWVDSLPIEEWAADAVGEFALILKFERPTWLMLRRRKPEAETFYWQRVRPWTNSLTEDELEETIKALLQNQRPKAAIDTLSGAINSHKLKPSWKIVADAVELASGSSDNSGEGDLNAMPVWELCEVMKYLQADPTADQDRLALLEWRLLPLARHDHFTPKLLHSELSQNPSFFNEVISAVYRAKGQPREENPDQTKQNIADAAHNLLDSWLGVPGTKSDGTIDPLSISTWVAIARKSCEESGRIEVCDQTIGEQLSYAPSDPDELWPCEAVREILEAVPTDEILRGFNRGFVNQRGVTTRGLNDGGEQERVLEKKYLAYAEKCKVQWPHTALALQRIAAYYEDHAKWHDEHAESRV